SELFHNVSPLAAFVNGSLYDVRFRLEQQDAATSHLYARVWLDGTTEPLTWDVEGTDTTVALQGINGGIAVDSWSSHQSPTPITAHTLVDDVVVTGICP